MIQSQIHHITNMLYQKLFDNFKLLNSREHIPLKIGQKLHTVPVNFIDKKAPAVPGQGVQNRLYVVMAEQFLVRNFVVTPSD